MDKFVHNSSYYTEVPGGFEEKKLVYYYNAIFKQIII